MALTSKQKAIAAAAGLLALLGLASAARADDVVVKDDDDDDDDDDDVVIVPACDPGFSAVPGPVGPNGPTWVCVPDKPVPPPPAAGHAKNYVGSGYDWPYRDRFPTEFSIGAALNLLGYGINPAASIISGASMYAVREFQADYNAAAQAQTVDEPAVPSQLATDALVGKNTLRAIINAQRWTSELNVDWLDIVELA